IPPRRVWDLCSNRVIPFAWLCGEKKFDNSFRPNRYFTPVSHSWVSPEERTLVTSTINNGQWDIPMPNDVSLENLREQMLQLSGRYLWLDVLCLRQECEGDDQKEDLRLEEWKMDIPTIGSIYHSAQAVIVFFNGVGRKFRATGLEDER
ncbi:hypothetical protein BDZ91DRAFT_639598, partial [Kalaharituber pfeilii]